MTKDVHVKITGYQTVDDNQTDVNEEWFDAQYFFKGTAHYLMSENEKTAHTARYKFNHRMLEVIKDGDLHGKLTFEAGKCCDAIYRTPYGRMPFTFDTKQISFIDEPNKMTLEACYDILNNGVKVSANRTVMEITPIKNAGT